MAPKKKSKEEQEAERLRLEEEAKAAEQGTKKLCVTHVPAL